MADNQLNQDSREKANDSTRVGIISILIAASLFGLSAPLSKILLGTIQPLHLAGYLYLGSGVGLSLVEIIRRLGQYFKTGSFSGGDESGEAKLQKSDYKWLAGAILCGGVLAPIMLTFGLSTTPASVASLFLNSESILTALVAFLLFGEAVGKRIWLAIVLMMISGTILSYEPSNSTLTFPLGILLIIGACLMWGFDNNLTRHLSDKDPFIIARSKGLVAGVVSLSIAWVTGEASPPVSSVINAMVLGAFSYGISLVLFVYALRFLGAARTGGYFGTAPFIGAVFSILLLKDPVTWKLTSTFILIAIGMWLLMKEDHAHEHTHEPLEHEHIHVHDEHHQHEHSEGIDAATRHSHKHVHNVITHIHAHMPDIHHRHAH